MNIFEELKFKEVKIKGIVDLQIIDKKTGEVIDELHLENTETIQAQIFAGYLPDKVGFILEDLNQFLPGQDVAYIKKILWFDEVNYKIASSYSKTKISDTQYEYGFSYNPDLGEETIYAITIFGDNAIQNPSGTYIASPFTILVLPNPITVNQDYAIVGKYTIYLDKVPYTFSTQVDVYHFENTNTVRTDFEIDPDYYLWYLENRTFIHPIGSTAWFGVEQAAIQSTGQIKINFNPDFWNFAYNYFSHLGDDIEIKREIFKNLIVIDVRSYRYDNTNARYNIVKSNYFQLKFLNTGDSTSINYNYFRKTDFLSSYYDYTSFQMLGDIFDKYLYGISSNSLMVKDLSYYSGSYTQEYFRTELYNVSRFKLPKDFNYIDNYKVPFAIYKECIWSKYYPIDYMGDKNVDKKFVLIKKVDANISHIFKPDGTYDVYDNTNYQTSTPSITTYLLTFNELQNIINTEGTNLDWFTGIYITPDDWIHINGIDEFKGIDAVVLTSGDYYLSDGTYKTLTANTNGYLWRPITGDIINLDDNTTVDTGVVIRDMPRIFRKDLSRIDTHLVNLPVYDKTNLTRNIAWYSPYVPQSYSGYPASENNNKNGIDFNTGSIPNYIMERIITPTFIDNISPSFVQDEFATFFLGHGFPIDLLQIIDINVFRNIPFREYYIGRYDTRLPKEVKRIDYANLRNITTEFLEIEQVNSITIPKSKRLFDEVENRWWDFSYTGNDYSLDFSQVEPPDIVIPIYTTKRVQPIVSYPDYSYTYIDIDYLDLDIEIDEYLIQNSFLLVYQQYSNNLYYKLPAWLELWIRDKKRLIFSVQLPYDRHPNFRQLMLFLYDNPNVLYKDASLYRFVNDKKSNNGNAFIKMAHKCITGDAIFLRNQ